MMSKQFEILPNQTVIVYKHINMAGRIYYNIENESKTNKLTFWWIKGPFGGVEGVGQLSGKGSLEIKGKLWGRLKASSADSRTIIQIAEGSSADVSFPDIKF